jgi:hypothetical protein
MTLDISVQPALSRTMHGGTMLQAEEVAAMVSADRASRLLMDYANLNYLHRRCNQ